MIINITDQQIQIDTSIERIVLDDVREMLATAHWCPGITVAEIQQAQRNSALVVGAFLPSGKQIGYLRVVSDKTRFAYFMDVIVHEHYRRQGIGQAMVRSALAHEELQDVYQWFLLTPDAHGVYAKCGFQPLAAAYGSFANFENWMAIIHPRPERTSFEGQ